MHEPATGPSPKQIQLWQPAYICCCSRYKARWWRLPLPALPASILRVMQPLCAKQLGCWQP